MRLRPELLVSVGALVAILLSIGAAMFHGRNDMSDRPSPLVLVSAREDTYALLGTLTGRLVLTGNCLYIESEPQIDQDVVRRLLVFRDIDISWDPIAHQIMARGSTFRVGDTIVVGGGRAFDDAWLDSPLLIEPPASDCDAEGAWFVSRVFHPDEWGSLR